MNKKVLFSLLAVAVLAIAESNPAMTSSTGTGTVIQDASQVAAMPAGEAAERLASHEKWTMTVKGRDVTYNQYLTVHKLDGGALEVTIVGGYVYTPQIVKDLKFDDDEFEFKWRDKDRYRDIRCEFELEDDGTFSIRVSGPYSSGSGRFVERGVLRPQ